MSKMIQIRNVPEQVHRTLKSRAAAAGLSLSDYIKQDLEASAARPSFEEVDARVRARRQGGGGASSEAIVAAIREMRDS